MLKQSTCLFVLSTLALVALACGSTEGSNGEGVAGAGGTTGTGGMGGFRQIASEDATSAEECMFLGIGGSDNIGCEYITATFSTPLDPSELSVEVTTSNGDALTPIDPPVGFDQRVDRPDTKFFYAFDDDPVLVLALDSASDVAGFWVFGVAETPRNSPQEITVRVTVGDALLTETTLEPEYACFEETSDDWCWQAEPVTIDTAP